MVMGLAGHSALERPRRMLPDGSTKRMGHMDVDETWDGDEGQKKNPGLIWGLINWFMVSTSVSWDRIVDDLSSNKDVTSHWFIYWKTCWIRISMDKIQHPNVWYTYYIYIYFYNYTYRYLPAHLFLSVSPGFCLLSQCSFESKFLASPIVTIIITKNWPNYLAQITSLVFSLFETIYSLWAW